MALTKTQRKYDGQECWEKYMGWGAAASHIRLRRWLREEKGLDIELKGMGAFFSMWKYAILNPEETFPQYRKWYFETASQEGVRSDVSFQDYLQDLKKHGKMRSLIGRREYNEFCAKYNLSE
jgi:hypothetical protein